MMTWGKRFFCSLVLVVGLMLSSGVAFAQTSVFDKFEQVRAYTGGEMLGAAERTAYNLDVEEASVFVLMLEDELKGRWLDVNKAFLNSDLQQIMRSTFGNEYTADKLDSLPEYNVKRIVREALDSGYTIEDKGGHFYPWPDYEYLLRAYDSKLNDEVKDYLKLCLADSESLAETGASPAAESEQKVAVIVQAENYLQTYPHAYRRATVAALYRTRLSEYLVKMGNSAWALQDGQIDRDVVKSYQNTAAKYPGTKVGLLSGQVADAWRAQDYNHNDTMISFLAELDKTIDLATNERIKGIYINNKGLDLFKVQGQKGYMLLSGQVIPIYKAQQQFSDTSSFVVLELKGSTEKTIPADLNNIAYPQVFTVEHILGASAWNIDSELFPADFLAYSRNPAWSLRILTNDEVIFESASFSQPVTFPYAAPVVTTKDGRQSYSYKLQAGTANTMTVDISQEQVRDSLAGIDYAYKAVVSFNGRKYEGFAFKQGEFPGNPDMIKTAS